MIFGSDGDGDKPSLIIDGVRIPFQMEAHVSYGPAEGGGDDDGSDWDDDAPWMITLPVEIEVTLPYEVLYPQATRQPALPTQEHADPDPRPDPVPAAWGPGPIPLPRIRNRRKPVTLRALQSLRLDETLGRRADGRSGGLPDLAGLVFPAAPDADDPTDAADDWQPSATGTGATGQRALDAAFAAGPIKPLHRMLRSSGDANGPVGTPIQSVVDRHMVTTDPATATKPTLVPAAYGAQVPPIPRPAGPAGLPMAIAALAVAAIESMAQSRGPDDKEIYAAFSRLKGELDVIGKRVAEATGDALTAIEGEVQAIAEELHQLERRSQGQLKRNTLRLLSQARPDLKEGLNKVPGQTTLVIHHTVPYADSGAKKARDLLQKWASAFMIRPMRPSSRRATTAGRTSMAVQMDATM